MRTSLACACRTLALIAATCTIALVRPPFAQCAAAQIPAPKDSVMPAGIDFTGVDRFWPIIDILARNAEPTPSQWQSLLSAPGYRLALVNLGRGLQDDIDLTYKPSRHAEFLKATASDDDHVLALKHLALVGTRRAELIAYRDSLVHATPIADALALAKRFLPPGATDHGAPPLVAFAFFRDDGYSLPQGIVVDLLYARVLTVGGVPVTRNLAHEFHHSYVNRMAKPLPTTAASAPDADLRTALYDLRNEGLADLIDKSYPFTTPNPGLANYAKRYNVEYARTPAVLRELDTLLTRASEDSTKLAGISERAMTLFWSNGHPQGAYIAREILDTFGVDSLYPAVASPAAFLHLFASAERRHGRPNPFSAAAWRELDTLDARYWRSSSHSTPTS
jgi:hypothetical protein